MNIRISNWVVFALLLCIGLLIFALIKGCNNIGTSKAQLVDYKGRIDKLEKDSIEFSKQLIDNSTQKELLEGQIEIADNKNIAYLDSFRTLNGYINVLKKRYKPVTPNIDTNITTVPNQYIEDCAGCFSALDKAQQLGLRYKSDLDNKDNLNLSKVNLLNKRIGILENQNAKLGNSYRSLLDSASKQQGIRRTLFLSLGAIAINQTLPNGIGGGFLYEDKKRRVYGGRYYISRYGSVYQADISFPLSLKFK